MRYGLPALIALALLGCTQKPPAETPVVLSRTVTVNGLDIGVTRLTQSTWGAWLVGPSLIGPSQAKVRAAERKAIEQVSACKVTKVTPGDNPMRAEYVELTVAC
ncbi:hypothetical protein [Inquilinus sp. Marseille-Q2685]|uniref:hypothetical protein n=1 Tax=Inquilinus sp. Marseille-Q2685 TaxID=2866581 RepID=UPI001CE492EE|nr:hypothetical protein [Inquilinus sp. Marseille-Q2685]